MSVYFDHNSTTRLAEPALEAMLPFLQEQYGNAEGIAERQLAAGV